MITLQAVDKIGRQSFFFIVEYRCRKMTSYLTNFEALSAFFLFIIIPLFGIIYTWLDRM